jgi:predicted methyltransferase
MNTINQIDGKNWTMIHGDSVECIKGLPDKSVGLCVHSPPFSSIYTYSNSDRDMGNCKDDKEFFVHYKFLIAELARYRPGRIVLLGSARRLRSVSGAFDIDGIDAAIAGLAATHGLTVTRITDYLVVLR